MRFPYHFLMLLVVFSSVAKAAELPGISQPGQVEKQFRPLPALKSEPSKLEVPPSQTQQAPAQASKVKFILNQIHILGANPTLSQQFTPLYQAYIGQEISLDIVYQIAAKLVKQYRNQGYILTNVIVPAQTIENGQVTLQVVEGYIAAISVTGDADHGLDKVLEYGERIKHSQPLNSADLERYLLLMNDIPGINATATLSPSADKLGGSDLILSLKAQKVSAGVSVDNRGGRLIGPLRINTDIRYSGLFNQANATTLRYVTTGDNELNYLALAHELLVSDNGAKVNLQYQEVMSKPEDIRNAKLNIETDSRTFEAGYMYPLIRSRTKNVVLHTALNLHSGKTDILGLRNSNDKLTVMRLGVSVDQQDAFNGINLLNAEYSHGLQALGASSNGDAMLSRPEGRVDFSKISLSATRLQSLSQHWSILAAVDAQYAFTNLLSSELYGYGGQQFGRGYDPSEMVGDHGWASKLEIHYDGFLANLNSNYTVYGFYDAGRVYQRANTRDSQDQKVVTSAGLGLRLNVGKSISAYTELAQPINKDVSAEGNRDMRVYLGLSLRI